MSFCGYAAQQANSQSEMILYKECQNNGVRCAIMIQGNRAKTISYYYKFNGTSCVSVGKCWRDKNDKNFSTYAHYFHEADKESANSCPTIEPVYETKIAFRWFMQAQNMYEGKTTMTTSEYSLYTNNEETKEKS